MKRILIIAAGLLALTCCGQPDENEQKVMARYVPERADDFVFENNLVCGRIYGKALEGNPTSPGVDIWVKLPGKLVANEWYAKAKEETGEGYYHRDHGGKDCYKVGKTLGGGGSVPLIDGKLVNPPTNWRSYEMLEESADKVSFVLHYPEWETEGIKITLDKKITVVPDSYFFLSEDCWTFSGTDSLCIAAGINRHLNQQTIEDEVSGEDYYAIWEHASDTSHEPEDGMLGVAVVMPGADSVGYAQGHGICVKKIVSGQTLSYRFGSCWSKGDIKDAGTWFDLVEKQK